MTEMRIASAIFALAGFALGVVAAAYWLKASRVLVTPVWGDSEPRDPLQSMTGWVIGLLEAGNESARLNRIAASLTAAAVFFSTAAGVAGLFG